MNITEFMSFDLEWFTTLPGILITGGVVVLLIALIFFIASNKKEKNNAPEVASVDNSEMSYVDNGIAMEMSTPDMTSVPNMPIDNNFVMNNDLNTVNPVENNINEMPEVSNPVEVSAPAAVVPESPVVVPNVVDFSTPVQTNTNEVVNNLPINEINEMPTVEVNSPVSVPVAQEVTPVVSEPVVPEVAPVEETVVEEKPVIYGGANPASMAPEIAPEKPVIYGGANPLENTTTIPTITNQVAYGATPVVPTEPVVPTVQEAAPVETTAPVINEVIPSEPIVPEVSPVVEPTVTTTYKPEIPMTGEEMFGSSDVSTDTSSNDEIETLDF